MLDFAKVFNKLSRSPVFGTAPKDRVQKTLPGICRPVSTCKHKIKVSSAAADR